MIPQHCFSSHGLVLTTFGLAAAWLNEHALASETTSEKDLKQQQHQKHSKHSKQLLKLDTYLTYLCSFKYGRYSVSVRARTEQSARPTSARRNASQRSNLEACHHDSQQQMSFSGGVGAVITRASQPGSSLKFMVTMACPTLNETYHESTKFQTVCYSSWRW